MTLVVDIYIIKILTTQQIYDSFYIIVLQVRRIVNENHCTYKQ